MLTPDRRSDPYTPGAGTEPVEASVPGSGEVASVPRTLIVVRHGRTLSNAGGLLLGRGDPPLDEVGRAQALAVAGELASGRLGPVVAVVSSPLGRARETAGEVARRLGLPVRIDERLIEIDYGELEAMPLTEVPPALWTQWRSDVQFRPAGGETLAELGERVQEACIEWSRWEPAGGAVVLVSHVSPIKAAVAWALGVDVGVSWRTHLDTASITRIVFRAGQPVLALFNETAHLK